MCVVYIRTLIGRPFVTVSMERNSVNWATGKGLSNESYFPNFAFGQLDWAL